MSTTSCLMNASSGDSLHFRRERNLIRLLMVFIGSGLFFMLIPGTLIGVMNLLQISSFHKADAAALLWIQAHGHAQLFGWLGTFILGIGFYSVPNLRKVCSTGFYEGWLCWALWVSGVALRWYAALSSSFWQPLYILSSVLELSAVAYFTHVSIVGSRLSKGKGLEPWALLIVIGSVSWLLLMLANFVMLSSLVMSSTSPLVPPNQGGKFLFVSLWAFVVPIVWGLSARWLPALLSLPAPNSRLLTASCFLNLIAVSLYVFGVPILAESLLLLSSVSYVLGLKLFTADASKAKVQGVHRSYPQFLKLAYSWLLISGILFVVSSLSPEAHGFAGAARHAITVGFFSTMAFTIGPRVLPAFLGRRKIHSENLMLLSLALLSLGCLLRVLSQILAYDYGINIFWNLLPISALIELSAMCVFALNMFLTFRQKPFLDEINSRVN